MSKDLNVLHDAAQRRFEIELGDSVAFAAYALHDNNIVFTHTEVPPRHEGNGIGTLLIKAGLGYARDQSLTVIPSCPFFAAYMKKHSEVRSLLSTYDREKLGIA